MMLAIKSIFFLVFLNVAILLQGRNGEIRYNIREGDAEPAQALSYFYVDPYTGTLSVTKSLNEDVDQPNRYRVC